MNKEGILADLETKTLRVISVEKQDDTVKEGVNVTSYLANVMEQRGESAQGRNIGFYVFDEGTENEVALYRDIVNPKNVAREAVIAYMEGLRPESVLWYAVMSVDEEQRVARVAVIDAIDMKEKTFIVYKLGKNPVTHQILSN